MNIVTGKPVQLQEVIDVLYTISVVSKQSLPSIVSFSNLCSVLNDCKASRMVALKALKLSSAFAR